MLIFSATLSSHRQVDMASSVGHGLCEGGPPPLNGARCSEDLKFSGPPSAPTFHTQPDVYRPHPHEVLRSAEVEALIQVLGAVVDGEGGALAMLGNVIVTAGLEGYLWLCEVPQPLDLGRWVGACHLAGERHVAPREASFHRLSSKRGARWGSEEGKQRQMFQEIQAMAYLTHRNNQCS